ncbi:diguanylate cyclase [Shewanella xiamenensis]|uniref:GGDEF domain-containing response regulator n=1 Tax=Shewanella xiamenensis TaxID=332186 RepID=UPI0024485DE3|nr:diguanylate cyclase [Shewanella xiamenensis]MDH1314861.1 diguanylate cyclase [Shewanella xiamenensis]
MDDFTPDVIPEVLIIDDDSTVVMALYAVLNKMARIRFAGSAKQAYQMIRDLPPDLILLDVELPDGNGVDVCIKLKAEDVTQNTPILFITSKIEIGFEEKVFDAGGADYILKPLKPRVVAARVNTHLAYHFALVQLSKLAHTDGLSGLPNRRSLDEQLEIEFRRARRNKEPLSVIMCDIDEFKKYNDFFGHLAGDDCIKTIGEVLKNTIKRPADMVARYGGEEFVLILPNTDRLGTENIIVSLMSRIEKLAMPHSPTAKFPFITVSYGITTMEPASCDFNNITPNELLIAADKALYRAKHQGRNQYQFEEFVPSDI